ncbi:Ubiquinone biosynthesis O-methyltransferase [Polaromonas vacuolata]|uniref:Ubiquinone biosynthesis O-methyltransferase n=1 Tax=Polaromonas vacuolata TaxID=37448 RepID=A0A6H2H8G9_9BURK|nr:class I SAM-dependent methyltransferase [Polaromonas vacuolata]QJC55776.1 Ubiquinone biosynthesis O-methyltransferase [Polaromonas vacuolata]
MSKFIVDKTSKSTPPWHSPWPANELERVPVCPVCGSIAREVLHQGLIDNVFYCAPGKWTSWRCSDCQCSYLDPRPSQASIHLAYGTYYTHQKVPPSKAPYATLASLRKFRRSLVNGYTNWRFSTREVPANRLGVLAFLAAWPLKQRIDREYRHLPRLPNDGTLLDVGCGNGGFMQIANACGWDVVGVDPDPKAVINGRCLGLIVLEGGIESFEGQESMFDVITLNHVIEHVHDPVSVLKACYRLLKPAGRLWLETPNIDSMGHSRYLKNWRGIESPRHLVLFNRQSLNRALNNSGFSSLHLKPGSNPLVSMTQVSEAIEQGLPIDHDIQITTRIKLQLIKQRLLQTFSPSCKEFLTIVAIKE